MGLPRSSLVKPKSAPSSSPAGVVVAPASSVKPVLETATTFPQMPRVEVAVSPRAPSELSIDVDVSDEGPATPVADGPSADDLLQRAARMGPARLTWESIVISSDPVLDEKRQPRIAERRERLTKFVGATLAGCVALCIAAVAASALSSSGAQASVGVGKAVPSIREPSIEGLANTTVRGKAGAHRAEPPSVAAAPPPAAPSVAAAPPSTKHEAPASKRDALAKHDAVKHPKAPGGKRR